MSKIRSKFWCKHRDYGHRDEIEENQGIANPLPSMQGALDITQSNESQMESLNPSFAAMQVSKTQPLPPESLDTVSQALGDLKPSYISSQQANCKSDVKYQVFHQPVKALYTGPVYNVTNGNNSIYGNVSESKNVMNSLKADSQMEDGGTLPSGKLHANVLNRCIPTLVRDIDFKTVSLYIVQKELFDDTTMRDITDQKTDSDKIRELIKHVKLRDKNTYEKFKECLVKAKQEFLKDMLEKEEAKG